jgi:predicted transcriptional regulator
LPQDYPMVAPDYAARRSVLAKSIGLGRKPGQSPTPAKTPAKAGTRKSKKAA